MAIRNQSWYNLNSTRDYPLSDTASAISDKGDRLPQDIVTDLRIRWSDLLGDYAFAGAVAVTKGAVTVTVLTSTDLSNAANAYTPVASISVPLAELVVGRQYPLDPMYPAVFGYIVFGSGTAVPWSGTFSSPEQSLWASRSARAYEELPVRSLGRLYDETALTGVIKLEADAPLDIVKGERSIGGIDRDVIVIRLVDDAKAPDEGSTIIEKSAFEEFVGKCGTRPESLNCGSPEPIQSINAVGPDCDGVVCINFKGCALVGRNTDDCGIIVDCGIGLSETCEPPYLPDMAGTLPSEKFPVIPPVPPDPEPVPTPEESISEGYETTITLPHCDPFIDEIADYFSIQSGNWTFVEDNSPDELCFGEAIPGHWKTTDSCSNSDSESCSIYLPPVYTDRGYSYSTESGVSGGTQNVSIFTPDAQTLYRKYQTDIKMIPGSEGMKHNGGICVNYKSSSESIKTFYLLELDYDDAEFRLVFFNGLTYVPLAAQSLPELALNDWYNLEFELFPTASMTGVYLRGYLTGITDPSLSVTMLYTVSWANYRDDSELAGLHTYRAHSRFSYWRVSEQPS
jgi:hypothetical protein|tara:strand:- start:3621 stop:5324 length:1704 start_codon:yes stop_codon:yes gene_type:complete